MWDLKSFCIYTLRFQEKNYVFSMSDLKPINIYSLCFQEKSFFLMWDKNNFGLNTST